MNKDKIINNLNNELKKYRIPYNISVILFVGSIILGFLLHYMDVIESNFIILTISSIFISIGIYLQTKMKKIMVRFKKQYFPQVIKQYMKDGIYKADRGISPDEIRSAEIFPYFDIYNGTDYIAGTYNNVYSKSSDIELKEKVKFNRNTKEEQVFNGRMYVFKFNKHFKKNLVLVQKKDYWKNNVDGNFKTESILANSEFRIFSEDAHEGFYILTPHLIEKLLYLDNKYKDQIMISFNKNKMYFIDYSKNSTIDFKYFGKVKTKFIDSIFDKINDVIELVELLDLENELFIKR